MYSNPLSVVPEGGFLFRNGIFGNLLGFKGIELYSFFAGLNYTYSAPLVFVFLFKGICAL